MTPCLCTASGKDATRVQWVPHALVAMLQVKRDTAIRDILLSRKGDRHLRELLTQDLLQQPRQLRGTTSYYIGCNGLWLMQLSGLQSRG